MKLVEIRHEFIYHQDTHVELYSQETLVACQAQTERGPSEHTFSHMRNLHQELVKFLLTIRQLSTPAVIHSEAVHDTIDDKQPILTTGELLCECIE